MHASGVGGRDETDVPCASSRSASVSPESCASKKASTSSITPSSSTSDSSSDSSSSSLASSIANGVRSIRAAAFAAAWNMLGIGENSADADGILGDGVTGLTVRVEADVEAVSVLEESLVGAKASDGLVRLALEAVRRIVGVRSDSRALGSSRVVYFPIAGRVNTYVRH